MLHTLYVDMNSFFASVEQQLDPSLRGRPVAVVPMHADTTSVLAASYQAKKFGVKTGVRVGDAKRMCPGLVCVEGNHGEYTRFHHKVLAAIDTIIPVDRVCSIDEAACKLLREQRELANAIKVGHQVKKAITTLVGECMTCSVGIAPTRFLAKIAADMQKPDGLTVIQKSELPQRLYHLDLIDLPGIGRNMLARLQGVGISTVERLCSLSEDELGRAWKSVIGREWYHWLRGEATYEPPTVRRTIGHSNVLSPKRRNEAGARAVAIRLLTKVGQRARHMGYVADQLTLSVTYLVPRVESTVMRKPRPGDPPSWWHKTVKITSINDSPSLIRALAPLWDAKPPGPLLKLGIVLHDLTPSASATGSLFEDRRDLAKLSKAMDAINQKYGSDAVYPASMQDARKAAPRRIAFGNIPDLDVPDIDR